MVKASEPVIRWMIRRDMPTVLLIDSLSFPDPLPEQELIKQLRRRNAIGMVVDDGDRVIAFMVYELHNTRVQVLRLAVHPNHRRRGIGAMMIEKLRSKLSYDRRNKLGADVREANLGGQLFLRAMDFRCVSTASGLYEDTGEDAYLFFYRHPTAIDEQALAEAVSRS